MHCRIHLKPGLGAVPLARLEPAHVQRVLNAGLAAGLSSSSVQRIRSTLRAALNQAVKWGEVSRNVAALAEPPKVTAPEVRPLSPDEARVFLDALRGHRWETLYTLALATGMRRGEVLGLRWSDVDLAAGTVTVRNSLQRVNGERVLVEPKTARGRRTIVLPPTVTARMPLHRAAQGRDRLRAGDGWHDGDFLFTSKTGRPLSGAEVTREFQRLLSQAGLPRKRFHDLRHSCATFLLAEGVSPRDVMAILGHSGISVTMNTYAHVLPETQQRAAERMDRVLWGDRHSGASG